MTRRGGRSRKTVRWASDEGPVFISRWRFAARERAASGARMSRSVHIVEGRFTGLEPMLTHDA